MKVDGELRIRLHESSHAVASVARGGRFRQMAFFDVGRRDGFLAGTYTSDHPANSEFVSFAGPWCETVTQRISLAEALEQQKGDARHIGSGCKVHYSKWSRELSGLWQPILRVSDFVMDHGPEALRHEHVVAALRKSA